MSELNKPEPRPLANETQADTIARLERERDQAWEALRALAAKLKTFDWENALDTRYSQPEAGMLAAAIMDALGKANANRAA